MGLIDNQGVITIQKAIVLDLRQQDAIGHDLDPGRLRGVIGKAHLVTDLLANLFTNLLGDAGGDTARGNPARLSVANQPTNATAMVQADFWNLGGFTGAGFASDDHHLMMTDGLADVVHPITDR